MKYDRAEYETKINDSPLFSLNKETQYNAYRKEALKMVEYLYFYLCAINYEKYSDLGCEIVELANRCINNYDISKGVFLHYFNTAWKNEYKRIRQVNIEDDKYRGLHISETDKRNVRRYMRLAQNRGVDCNTKEFTECLSNAMNLTETEVIEIIGMSEVAVISNEFRNENGEIFDLFDMEKSTESADRKLLQAEDVHTVFNRIEEVYNKLQDRQKKIISDVITAKICDNLEDICIWAEHFDFINIEILERYKKTGEIPTQRDIAQKYNRDEASISRTLKQFKEKLC